MFSKGTTQAKNIDLYLNNTAGIFPYELLEHTDYFLYLKDNHKGQRKVFVLPLVL